MDFEGFFGIDLDKYKRVVLKKYEELFAFHREFNHFLNKLRLEISVDDNDYSGIVMVGIFSKSLETYQSIYFLFTNSLLSPGASLSRVLFEEMVSIGYCNEGEKEFYTFLAKELYKKKKLMNVIERNPNLFPKEVSDPKRIRKNREWVKNKLAEYGDPNEISVQQMAQKIGLSFLYETYYRIACNEVHTEPYILDRYFMFSDEGFLESFSSEPETEGYARFCISSFEFMLRIINYLAMRFKTPSDDDLKKYNDKIKVLAEKYTENGSWK